MIRMDGPWDPIPDGIEPLVGYRAWTYTLRDTSGSLSALSCLPPIKDRWAGAESGWVTASCFYQEHSQYEPLTASASGDPRFEDHGKVPGDRCSCGFYSVKTLITLLQMFEPRHQGRTRDGATMGEIFGRVELAGKIIEHDLGYRAERARIAKLIPFEADLANGIRLATMLGLDLGDPVATEPEIPPPEPEPPLPPDGPSSLRLGIGAWVHDVAS